MSIFNNKGMLLLELTIGIAVMLVMVLTVVPLFINTTAAISRGTTQNTVLQEGRWALNLMARDISTGYFIVTPDTTNVDSSTLVFKRWDTSSDITYSIVNNELCRQAGQGKKYPLTDREQIQISSINFRHSSEENITIVLTIAGQPVPLQQTVYMLNAASK